MNKLIYCKLVNKGLHAFYIQVGKETTFLFNQKYHQSVDDYFKNGIYLDSLSFACKGSNRHVCKTIHKLPLYLSYIEKEYEIPIYDKTNKRKINKTKPKKFNWRTLDLEMI